MKKLLFIKILLIGILHFAVNGYARTTDEHDNIIHAAENALTQFSANTTPPLGEMEQSSKTVSTHHLTIKKTFDAFAGSFPPEAFIQTPQQSVSFAASEARQLARFALIFPFHDFW